MAIVKRRRDRVDRVGQALACRVHVQVVGPQPKEAEVSCESNEDLIDALSSIGCSTFFALGDSAPISSQNVRVGTTCRAGRYGSRFLNMQELRSWPCSTPALCLPAACLRAQLRNS